LGAAAAACIAALGLLTVRQAAIWCNSETLFRRTLAVTKNNVTTHKNLGNILSWQGRAKEAIPEYDKALDISPENSEVHNNMANTLAACGRVDDAIEHYRQAIKIDPAYAVARCNLGNQLLLRHQVQDALDQYNEALHYQSNCPNAHCGLGDAMRLQGNIPEAIRHYRDLLQIDPSHPARTIQAELLMMAGQTEEAMANWREALRFRPDLTVALVGLARIRATDPNPAYRDGAEAVRLAERACQLTKLQDPVCLATLAAAYAEAGRFDDAIATNRQAARLAASRGDGNLAAEIQFGQRLYEQHKPYRTPTR
jgi:tetratricopeptide (TPR) repeat protein